MNMVASTIELMNKGMRCLTEQMGVIEAEQFISVIMREKFDYTKWQREYFDAKTPEEISKEAAEYEKMNPYTGNAVWL